MIHTLQKLKAKRGFTIIELVVVLAIIAIMVSAVLVGSNNRGRRIISANSAASDFYAAMQTQFIDFQMFDGPLTLTLNKRYSEHNTDVSVFLRDNAQYAGMKYYPTAGGNYPYAFQDGETHLEGTPKEAEIYFEFKVTNGNIEVLWADTMSALIGSGAPANSELSAVMKQNMQDRLEYSDGYYYAKVSYTPPEPSAPGAKLSKYDYRTNSIKVDWTAYTKKEIRLDNSNTYTFKMQNVLASGQICGICASDGVTLGETASAFVTTPPAAP